MYIDDQLISIGEGIDQAQLNFIEDLRLFVIYNEVTLFIAMNKLRIPPIKIKDILKEEEKEIELDDYCKPPCFLTFPISGPHGARHYGLYIGKNEMYHINAQFDSSTAFSKIKATFKS